MDLSAAIAVRSAGRMIRAGSAPETHPVHDGAHDHFLKIGYMHTGNRNRGGIPTSHYFKSKGGNSREVAVQADGSYVKTSRTAKGMRHSRGHINADGIRADWTQWDAEHPYQPKGIGRGGTLEHIREGGKR